MATLQQALTRIDAICPNAWDETAKLLWLNECESMIQTRILGVAPEQCITYDADTDRSTALLVPAPFDRLYVYYVIAMCDYAAHETAHYADSMMLFNAALDEYAKWYQRANGAAPIAPGQLQQIAANTKARHTHENLAVLDGITAEKAAAWDAKADRTAATASANGLMSKADKAKLDGIAAGATKVTVDSALSNTSANPLQNKVIAAALDGKAGTAAATQSANGLMSKADKAKLDGIAAGATKVTVDSVVSASSVNPVQNKAIKQYVDSRAAGSGAVRYDATQSLTFEQKQQARKNIEAVGSVAPTTTGTVSMCPDHITDSNVAVHIVPSKVNDEDYTITLDCGPENWPVRVAGIRTPTDAQTNYAANVAYVKAKIAEVAASGGVDVDNALSATSTNPVQNKAITAALAGKAGTSVATTSSNGLMSKADKTKLDGIASGATKITIDSTMSGSSNNPVANHVVKQYVDDKVSAAGGNITVDATLSSTSANPVQNKAVKAAIDAKADKTALDAKADKTALNDKLDKTGGTLTGNLTGKYFCGTWLQSTEASDLGRTPGKIAVLDGSGWVYYRTPAELFGDLGIANAINSYVDTAIVAAINSAY